MTLVPSWIRSTDLREECPTRWLLQHLHTDEIGDAGYFILGTAVHNGIRYAIDEAIPLTFEAVDQVRSYVYDEITQELELHDPADVVWGKTRTADTIYEDASKLVNNWFDSTHPDSPDRIPLYEEYAWPPRTEIPISRDLDGIRVRTTCDALFMHAEHGEPLLVDWKTGVKTGGDKDTQLWTYRWGMGLPEGTVMAFHYVTGKALRFASTYPGDRVMEWMLKSHYAARMAEAFGPKEGWYCKSCRVRQWCPLYGGDEALEALRLADWDWQEEPE